MQGDDANQFLAEVENIAKAKMNDSAMNYFFSAYDEITAIYSTLEELDKIGITVKQKRNRKPN